jgi:hypothetical protein
MERYPYGIFLMILAVVVLSGVTVVAGMVVVLIELLRRNKRLDARLPTSKQCWQPPFSWA